MKIAEVLSKFHEFCPEKIDQIRIGSQKRKMPVIVVITGLAEMVGFEPSCDFTRNSISSRARYDHFDNSPCYISTQLLKSQPWKMERKVGEKTV